MGVEPTPLKVGGWTNPFEKCARQIGFIFPNFWGENKKYLKPLPRIVMKFKGLGFYYFQLSRMLKNPWFFVTFFQKILLMIPLHSPHPTRFVHPPKKRRRQTPRTRRRKIARDLFEPLLDIATIFMRQAFIVFASRRWSELCFSNPKKNWLIHSGILDSWPMAGLIRIFLWLGSIIPYIIQQISRVSITAQVNGVFYLYQ